MFGENPKFPALYSSGPPGFEEANISKTAAAHISAMHSAREAFVECEADRVLKAALKRKVYARGEDINPGSWIYFKNKSRKWEGPVKITTKDGKLLYAVRAGRLLTINIDHAVLAHSNGDVLPEKKNDVTADVEKSTENTTTRPTKVSKSGTEKRLLSLSDDQHIIS